ncbi:MAG TPA: hypothetical protein VFU90_07765, partial [Candidatus Tumulicola sp.]|nr:hypothetical protein [Candidatus Tumulicola sp.]
MAMTSETSGAIVRVAEDNTDPIQPFAHSSGFSTAQRMANALASSTMVPDAYRGNIANCLIALELAARIRASVLMVMNNLDIVHGRPSWRATFLIATVNTCGRFTPIRFRFEGTRGTDAWGCRAVATDKASGEECVGTLITIALAKAEGWYGRNGSKWQTIPEQMLQYRAAAFWVRIYCPELANGMRTTDEESDSVIDVVPEPVTTSTPAALEQSLQGPIAATMPAAAPA